MIRTDINTVFFLTAILLLFIGANLRTRAANKLIPIATLHAIGGDSASGTQTYIGFRTEYTEYDPRDGAIKCGFGGRWEYRNRNALFDNVTSSVWADMVNNLSIKLWRKSDGGLACRFGVYYL